MSRAMPFWLSLLLLGGCSGRKDRPARDSNPGEDTALPDAEDSASDSDTDSDDSETDEPVDTAGTMGRWGENLEDAASTIFERHKRGNRQLGVDLAGGQDFDGDGLLDVVVWGVDGDPGVNRDSLVMFAAPFESILRWEDSVARVSLLFEAVLDGFNPRVNALGFGDVSGDGLADVMVSQSRIYVKFAPFLGDASILDAEASFFWETYLHVAWAGDLDGDGVGDMLVSDTSLEASRGGTYVFRGPVAGAMAPEDADALYLGEVDPDMELRGAGFPISRAGDVNGDGQEDFLIGARYYDAGRNWLGVVYVVLGYATGVHTLDMADGRYQGEILDGLQTRIATNLSPAGDVNSDGYDDILVGSLSARAFLILGPALGEHLISEAEARMEGRNLEAWILVSDPGDVDGDGVDDVLIGAPGQPRHSTPHSSTDGSWGGVYLMRGPFSGFLDLHTEARRWYGEDQGGGTGSTVAPAGDVNGAGFADMLVTVPVYGRSCLLLGGI